MKIGIFGGSFNPPHNMHLNIAKDLVKLGYLDKVIYLPVGDKYNKNNLVPFKDRFNMVKLMIEDYDYLYASDISNDDRYSYTYQMLDYFNNNKDNIYFICGSDNLKEFDTWMEYEYILKNYKLLVIKRNDDDIEKILDKFNQFRDNIIITNVDKNILSSTGIRTNLEDNKNNMDNKVYEYIKLKGLYR